MPGGFPLLALGFLCRGSSGALVLHTPATARPHSFRVGFLEAFSHKPPHPLTSLCGEEPSFVHRVGSVPCLGATTSAAELSVLRHTLLQLYKEQLESQGFSKNSIGYRRGDFKQGA